MEVLVTLAMSNLLPNKLVFYEHCSVNVYFVQKS